MKYPIFSLLGIVLVGSGCFNPRIKEGGFACTGAQDGQCPTGFFCVNKVCVTNPNDAPGPGVGGNGGTGDMSMVVAQDMSMPGVTPPTQDLAQPLMSVDMAQPIVVVVDMAQPIPDMTKVNTCSHSPCKTGGALNASCDPCVNNFCNDSPLNGGDSFCCSSQWDSTCVSEYKAYGCTAC